MTEGVKERLQEWQDYIENTEEKIERLEFQLAVARKALEQFNGYLKEWHHCNYVTGSINLDLIRAALPEDQK